jgi:hypothetical protein
MLTSNPVHFFRFPTVLVHNRSSVRLAVLQPRDDSVALFPLIRSFEVQLSYETTSLPPKVRWVQS